MHKNFLSSQLLCATCSVPGFACCSMFACFCDSCWFILIETFFSDSPGPVDFEAKWYCLEVVILWTALSDSPSPITGYNIIINSSSTTVAANQTTYNASISGNDCASILQISMSAISAAGTGENTTVDIPINCMCECYCTIYIYSVHDYCI